MMPPKRKTKDGRRNNKPPKEYQFKKLESGNKKGRPPKSPPTFLDLVEEELNSKHSVKVGTRQIQVPLKVLLIKRLLHIAMKGNTKAMFLALEMLDIIQKANAKRHEYSRRPQITRDDINNMTEQQRTELYFKTLRTVNGEDDENE